MPRRSEAILQFIRAFRDLNGYAPTRREIGKATNLSTSVVSYQLGILQDAGHLTVDRKIARGIVLTEAAPDAGEWAALNRVARVQG